MLRSASIRVTGKVQGVFYRHHTNLKAQELGLKGFVQNEPDGSVFIHAQGETSQIDLLIAWCKQGPDAARVTAVEVTDAPHAGYEAFDIRR